MGHGNGLIILNRTGRAMDNAARRGNNGNPILGYRRNNTPAQIWAIESVRHGNHVHFRNIQRNKCLDDTGRKGVGQKYHLWGCSNGNKNQWFRLAAPRNNIGMKIPTGRWFNLVGPGGLCVEASNKNGHRLVQRTCNHENDLQWQFIPSNGGYIVRNRNAHVIDNSGARNRNGNPIIGYRQHGKPNQIWAAQSVNGNTFLLKTHKLTDAWMPLADTLTEDYTIYGAVQKETEINGSDLETPKEDQLLDHHLDLCQDLCQDQLLFLTSLLHQ